MEDAPSYPPDLHITRDLAPIIERDDNGSTILLPIVPALLDAGGRLHVGVAATAVDIICGESAIRSVLPDWVATLSLSLQIGEMPTSGTFAATPRILRQGRTTLVQEVTMTHVESGTAIGLGTVAFSILPGRADKLVRAHWVEKAEPRTTFAPNGEFLTTPLHEALGLRKDPNNASVVHADVNSYVINTLGAMQGGVVAMLIDAAGARHVAIDTDSAGSGHPAQVRSLEIHYLKLAKVGPIRANAKTVGQLGSAQLVRVELRDEGQADQLVTVASLVVERT